MDDKKPEPIQQPLTGFEEYVGEQAIPEFHVGKPSSSNQSRFFDAANLPDSPGYQNSADGANMCMVYVVCPDPAVFDRVIRALTLGARKAPNVTVKYATIDCLNPGKTSKPLLEHWEKMAEDFRKNS